MGLTAILIDLIRQWYRLSVRNTSKVRHFPANSRRFPRVKLIHIRVDSDFFEYFKGSAVLIEELLDHSFVQVRSLSEVDGGHLI